MERGGIMKIIREGSPYGMGSNPSGGTYVRFVPENQEEAKSLSLVLTSFRVAERKTIHSGGTPVDGGMDQDLQEILEAFTPLPKTEEELRARALALRKKLCGQDCPYGFSHLKDCVSSQKVGGCIFALFMREHKELLQ